jgi:hypothetical protein
MIAFAYDESFFLDFFEKLVGCGQHALPTVEEGFFNGYSQQSTDELSHRNQIEKNHPTHFLDWTHNSSGSLL